MNVMKTFVSLVSKIRTILFFGYGCNPIVKASKSVKDSSLIEILSRRFNDNPAIGITPILIIDIL